MNIDNLLSRLEKVRRAGPGRWIALCPAHADTHRSLSIRELDDGRTLIHCFAECPVDDVLAAIGLGLCDLYPERFEAHAAKGVRRPFPATEVLRALVGEVEIVHIFATDVANNVPLSMLDRARLVVAVSRLKDGLNAVRGYRHG